MDKDHEGMCESTAVELIKTVEKAGPIPPLADFAGVLSNITATIHEIAVEHGFWPPLRSDAECIALMHSELSEALEAMRRGDPPSKHIRGYTTVEEELADCIIRILDYAGAEGLRLGGAILAKVDFNKSRPHKHGKQF